MTRSDLNFKHPLFRWPPRFQDYVPALVLNGVEPANGSVKRRPHVFDALEVGHGVFGIRVEVVEIIRKYASKDYTAIYKKSDRIGLVDT